MRGAIAAEGAYRYWLLREWDRTRPRLNWVMLNPSTADAERDDPTLRRCLQFARGWGFGAVEVTNVYALRATTPRALQQVRDPVGPENDRVLRDCAARCDRVAVAWGNGGRERAAAVAVLLDRPLWCLKVTRQGQPRHPLYAPARLPLRPYLLPPHPPLPDLESCPRARRV